MKGIHNCLRGDHARHLDVYDIANVLIWKVFTTSRWSSRAKYQSLWYRFCINMSKLSKNQYALQIYKKFSIIKRFCRKNSHLFIYLFLLLWCYIATKLRKIERNTKQTGLFLFPRRSNFAVLTAKLRNLFEIIAICCKKRRL